MHLAPSTLTPSTLTLNTQRHEDTCRRVDKCRSVEECEVRRGRTSALRTNERGKKQNEKCRTQFIFSGPNYLKLKFTANDTRDFQRKNANFAAQYAAKKGSPFPCTPPKKHAHATARTTAPGFCLGPTLPETDPPNCDPLFGDFFFVCVMIFMWERYGRANPRAPVFVDFSLVDFSQNSNSAKGPCAQRAAALNL